VGAVANPLAPLADTIRALSADCRAAGKPSAFWLQLYGWDDVAREPTAAEARAMAYLAFIWGTRTLLYWSYKPMQPALWDAMPILARELAAIDTAFADRTCRWVRAGTDGRRVHYAVWHGADRFYVVAANASAD